MFQKKFYKNGYIYCFITSTITYKRTIFVCYLFSTYNTRRKIYTYTKCTHKHTYTLIYTLKHRDSPWRNNTETHTHMVTIHCATPMWFQPHIVQSKTTFIYNCILQNWYVCYVYLPVNNWLSYLTFFSTAITCVKIITY